MRRALLTISLLGTATGVCQPQQKQDAVAVAAARSADSYAIYSLLLNEQPFDALPPGQTSQLAIADTTVNIRDMDPAIAPDSALQPPADNPTGFAEAVRDFKSRQLERIQLSRHFSLNTNYTLLNAQQVNDFRNARAGLTPSSDVQQQYAGYPGITFLTQVYFDSRRSAALVYRNNWCGSPCANGQWFFLEKQGNSWVRRSGTETTPTSTSP